MLVDGETSDQLDQVTSMMRNVRNNLSSTVWDESTTVSVPRSLSPLLYQVYLHSYSLVRYAHIIIRPFD